MDLLRILKEKLSGIKSLYLRIVVRYSLKFLNYNSQIYIVQKRSALKPKLLFFRFDTIFPMP